MQKLINPRVSVGNSSFVFVVSSFRVFKIGSKMTIWEKTYVYLNPTWMLVIKHLVNRKDRSVNMYNVVIILKSHKL